MDQRSSVPREPRTELRSERDVPQDSDHAENEEPARIGTVLCDGYPVGDEQERCNEGGRPKNRPHHSSIPCEFTCAKQEADDDEVGDERAPARTDERQRDAGEWQESNITGQDDECL